MSEASPAILSPRNILELSADEKARLRAESREKALWDQAGRMRQSREEGMVEGMEKGRMDGQAAIVRRMLRAKMPLADIAGLTGCPMAEIERLAAEEKA